MFTNIMYTLTKKENSAGIMARSISVHGLVSEKQKKQNFIYEVK